MKQAQWGFLAGMLFMAAVIVVELSGLTLRQADAGIGYGVGIAIDMRDC